MSLQDVEIVHPTKLVTSGDLIIDRFLKASNFRRIVQLAGKSTSRLASFHLNIDPQYFMDVIRFNADDYGLTASTVSHHKSQYGRPYCSTITPIAIGGIGMDGWIQWGVLEQLCDLLDLYRMYPDALALDVIANPKKHPRVRISEIASIPVPLP